MQAPHCMQARGRQLHLCKGGPCLKANPLPLLKSCRYFCIFVWNFEKAKSSVYFVFVLTLLILGDPWADRSLFFIRGSLHSWP